MPIAGGTPQASIHCKIGDASQVLLDWGGGGLCRKVRSYLNRLLSNGSVPNYLPNYHNCSQAVVFQLSGYFP